MNILEQARALLRVELEKSGFDLRERVEIRPLHPDEAVGTKAAPDLAIRRGPEKVIQAEVGGVTGQAFTDQPQAWAGTVGQALDLDLGLIAHRAHVVALINTLMRRLGRCAGTSHCRNTDPETCGERCADEIEKQYGRPNIGMFGFQPYMVAGLVKRFGADSLAVADLNPVNIGQKKAGVVLFDGERDAETVITQCTLGLVTGSSIVNGTIDHLWDRFAEHRKPVIFFGNTISGAAALLGLDRYCPLAQ